MPHLIAIKIADVVIEIKSDNEDDIRFIATTFRHHLLSSRPRQVDHVIEVRREHRFTRPVTAKKSWDIRYLGAYRPIFWMIPWLKTKLYHATRYYDESSDTEYYRFNSNAKWIETDIRHNHTICHFIDTHILGRTASPSMDMTFIFLLHRVMSLHKRYAAHSAAVVVDGRCYAFLGTSGSGKSTLSTDLARNHGAKYLGDDVVYWYINNNGQFMVGSLLLSAKLFTTNPLFKDAFDIIEEHPEAKCETAPLDAFFLVNQTRKGLSTIEPMTKAQLLATFTQSTSSATLQHDKKGWTELMFKACDSIPLYRFNFGDRDMLTTDVFDGVTSDTHQRQ